ncbi:MAG: hypothetical protein JWN76_3261 [Chitinophagaceae bacterium]|nr:hypothetical protein [Chitinophagaceae bacterium]
MTYKIYVAIFCVGLVCGIPTTHAQGCPCKGVNNFNTSKSVDTVKVQAYFILPGELPYDPTLLKLIKKGRLKKSQYTYAVGFQLEGCGVRFYKPCGEKNSREVFKRTHFNKQATLTLILFNNLKDDYAPDCSYFLVSAVKF